MILLDTNVVSETFRVGINPIFRIWFGKQKIDELYICSPVLAELLYGVERLADGTTKRDLINAISAAQHLFEGRNLPFDDACAAHYVRATVERQRAGRRIELMDALIAGVAIRHRARLATRNVKDFDGLGLSLINPFEPIVD